MRVVLTLRVLLLQYEEVRAWAGETAQAQQPPPANRAAATVAAAVAAATVAATAADGRPASYLLAESRRRGSNVPGDRRRGLHSSRTRCVLPGAAGQYYDLGQAYGAFSTLPNS